VGIELSHLESPLGHIVLAVGSEGLCALEFAETDDALRSRLARWFPGVAAGPGERAADVAARIAAYFAGSLHALDEISVASVGTAFQKRVWAALRTIRVGETVSYRAIAEIVENPAAVRAVGAANGQNPIALVVPCHRVIASDGTLSGYAAGVWRKEWLLRHERALLA
jgi:O-6-methylguanine DNA methyltransferase